MRSHLVHHYYSMFSATVELAMVTSFHVLGHTALPVGFGAFGIYAIVTLAYLRHSALEARNL